MEVCYLCSITYLFWVVPIPSHLLFEEVEVSSLINYDNIDVIDLLGPQPVFLYRAVILSPNIMDLT